MAAILEEGTLTRRTILSGSITNCPSTNTWIPTRMSRELCLLRHGKAVADEKNNDFARPLTERGIRDAHNIGVWMRRKNWLPDLILSSPATRALATATQVAAALGLDADAIKQDLRLYFQGGGQIKAVLATLPPSLGRVLLVGHNPDLKAVLLDLAGSEDVPDRGSPMPTATLVRLKMPDDWQRLSADCGKIVSFTLARQLREAK